jgi:CMP-N-acetylneuraminic acid synthetase
MKVTALVPIKTYSERLKDKNFLLFCGQPLYQIVLDKLQAIDLIKEIVINTDSTIIANDCSKRYSKSIVIERPENIRSNEITMNTIIEYDLTRVAGEYFLQTHCTNPLISKATIVNAIHSYFDNLDKYDSLLSVQCIKKRAYRQDSTPINHINSKLEQTQNLPEILVENSNIFLFSRTSFLNASCSRVGRKPQLFSMSSTEGIDIDYSEDFLLAELINKNKQLFHGLD